jgi:hypothetical protein
MKTTTLRKFIILIVGLCITTTSILPSIGSAPAENTPDVIRTEGVSIAVSTMGDAIQLHYQLSMFTMHPVMINDNEYVQISLGQEPQSLIAGAPDIPSIHRSVIIPDTATMNIRVIQATYQEFKNIAVAPSKGNLKRTVNPEEVPYEFGEIYTKDAWYPSSSVALEDPYYLRDFRGQVVTVSPFQYNPVEATLRFYDDITIEVYPTQQSSLNSENDQTLLHVDSDFLPIYQNHFLNFNQAKYTPVSEQGNMLVIVYDSFYYDMVPFVQWKNMKGIPTEMVNVSTIGNANAIKSYIADYYNTNGLTFVLLVGDAAQVPTYMSGYVASDPSYGYIVGGDHYIDLFVGRFSAETVAHVQTQVNRTITYERYPTQGAEWYEKGVGIASSQGPGDDNEYDYQHIRNIRTLLLNFTYTFVDELYDGSQGGGDAAGNPTPTMVATALNEGRSIINYCGHGSPTSWGSSGFSNTNVNQLTNDNMLPFIVSVACNNGEFDTYTCFAEAWLRATNNGNGQPTGAIGAYMSTISQSWDPPMEAQDEFNNILVWLYADNIKTTYGALCYHGAMSMIDKYGSAGISEADAWTVFGDPSVQVRTDPPATMTVTHDPYINGMAESFELDAPGFPNALCALSTQGTLLAYEYTDTSGHAIIEIDADLSSIDEVQLVVTGFNTMPYITTLLVQHENVPPEKPNKPFGKLNGTIGTSYTYITSTKDPNRDQVYYMWDWGDGTFSEWLGPYESEEEVRTKKTWNKQGSYSIKVKAKDPSGNESEWSDPLDVSMPYNLPFLPWFITLLERLFPRFFQFIETLLQA